MRKQREERRWREEELKEKVNRDRCHVSVIMMRTHIQLTTQEGT